MIKKLLSNKSNYIFYTYLFSGISLASFILYQDLLVNEYNEIFQDLDGVFRMFQPAKHDTFWCRLPICITGVIGVIYGYLALINGKRIGVFGIIISTILTTITLAPKYLYLH